MWLIPLFLGILLVVGIVEKRKHIRNIRSIPIRINVNGIRGKSTVTRLITSMFIESGYATIGKTTGTAARMIYWDRIIEKPIRRRLEGPNISEQIRVISESARRGAQCLVSECMAVNPDYQRTFQNDMLKANIGVITNVLEDHLDVMGPTTDEVAEALTATIPYKGHLIINNGPYVHYFRREAHKRQTQVHVADHSRVEEAYLKQFQYMVFPDNVALALAVARVMGIHENVALQGMLKAAPDPGAVSILPLRNDDQPAYFVNGFAANDPFSTLRIWERLSMLGYPTNNATVVMNCRADRVDRTKQFARDVLPYISMDKLVLIGEITGPVVDAYTRDTIRAKQLVNLQGRSIQKILNELKGDLFNRVIYGIGNIHGIAEPLCASFEKLYEQTQREQQIVRKKKKVSV